MVNYADSSPAIIDCTFSGNTGGGMYNLHSSSTVIGCTFSGNDAVVGGGMRNDWSSPAIIDCTFSNNEATSWAGGGGMRNWHGSPIVIGCTFEANTADDGGGMHNGWNSPTVIGCMFSGNGAMEYGGGMYNFHSSLTVTNCTFTGNSATNGHALAFDSSGPQPPSDLLLANCILWGGGEYLIWNNDDSTINITYSNVQGGYPGLGNIDADPLFVDVPGGNYRLSPGSPCIDAGDNTAVPEDITTDLDGNPRFLEIPETDDTGNGDLPIVDMGAYESLGGGCLAITSQEVICHGDGSTFTVNAEGLDACTGGTTMVTFTGMGGAVGEDFCATLIVNSGEGGFCCSTQLCVLVPDCSGSALPCDLDGDGVVGVLDFLVLLGAWGTNPIHPADFDGDGDVGVTDLLILLANWG
jgi:parallel beta-helix repeat protein